MSNSTWLIIGASSGLGYALAEHGTGLSWPFVHARAPNSTTAHVSILRLRGPFALCIRPPWGLPLGSAHSPA
jgi:hypothetical protein